MDAIKQEFANCKTQEEIYKTIIAFGKTLPPFDPAEKTDTNRVQGCQSVMYLSSRMENGKITFSAYSEALISAGLAALLIHFYSGKTPEEILTIPPSFLEEFNIPNSLTPGRANGLASLHLQMKRAAFQAISQTIALKNNSTQK